MDEHLFFKTKHIINNREYINLGSHAIILNETVNYGTGSFKTTNLCMDRDSFSTMQLGSVNDYNLVPFIQRKRDSCEIYMGCDIHDFIIKVQ